MAVRQGQAAASDARVPLCYAGTDALARIIFLLRASFIGRVESQAGIELRLDTT
jgi:hypothetical protein